MATDEYAREQRLRKQAEIQSLYTNLNNFRVREGGYIESGMTIPERLLEQIKETRQEIVNVEQELLALGDDTVKSPGRQAYRDGVAAEAAQDYKQTIAHYKSAARHAHPDANAALRSMRHTLKGKAGGVWIPSGQSKNWLWIGLAVILIIIITLIFIFSDYVILETSPAIAEAPTSTPTPGGGVILIVPTATSTLMPTPTSTSTPTPTDTPEPTPTEVIPTDTPTPSVTLRPPPKIIGPKPGLVWKDGAIVFEFEDMDLAYNELYCLNSMKGFDDTNTENWSHPAIGRKIPSIPVEASVFHIAKIQDIRCIVWSASIGVDSCDNIISQSTTERIIGLPQVCNFD